MEHMSNLAGLGHTVIASIHQPRSAIWEMFDKVTPADCYILPPCLAARLLQQCRWSRDLRSVRDLSKSFNSSRISQRLGKSYCQLVALSAALETSDEAHICTAL